jgi:hypothetical protein
VPPAAHASMRDAIVPRSVVRKDVGAGIKKMMKCHPRRGGLYDPLLCRGHVVQTDVGGKVEHIKAVNSHPRDLCRGTPSQEGVVPPPQLSESSVLVEGVFHDHFEQVV